MNGSLNLTLYPRRAALGTVRGQFTGTTSEFYAETDDTAGMYQTADTSTPVTATGQNVGHIAPTYGDEELTEGTTMPSWVSADGLLAFNTEFLSAAMPTRSSDMYFACIMDTADTKFIPLSANSGAVYALVSESGSTSTILNAGVGSPSYYVDGVLQAWTQRQHVDDALAVGSKILLEMSGLDLSGADWANITVCDYGTSSGGANAMVGNAGDFMLLADPGAAGRQVLRDHLMAKHGL